MANVTKPAVALARELCDRLKIRFSTLTLVETVASDGNPLLKFGALTTTTRSFIIKVSHLTDWTLAQDSLGNTALNYGPHEIQLATESNDADTSDNVADYLSRQDLMYLLGEIFACGTVVRWYEEASGTAPTASTLGDAAKLKGTWQHLYWPRAGA